MNKNLQRMLRANAAMLTALLATHCGEDPAGGMAPKGLGGQPTAGGSGGSSATAGSGGVAAGTGGAGKGTGGMAAAGKGGASGGGGSGVSGAGGTGTGGATGGAGGAMADAGAPPGQKWPVADLGADGPFESMTEPGSGPSDGYTLFYPQDLGRDGLKHPIVTWGNGAGGSPNGYTLLPRLATHGFVVIASESSSVTGALLKGGIDWLIAENARDGSVFKDKLDPMQVASMGYSLGSLGTFDIADDPRIKTTVHISGGSMDHSVVANLKNPAAFYCGNSGDIAAANCDIDFEMATVPVFYANFPGSHGGVQGAQAGQIAEASVAWLRWRLMGDTTLDAMFVGPDCTLCKDTAWDKVQQKDLDVAP